MLGHNARRLRAGLGRLAVAGLLLFAVGGTFSAWTQATQSPLSVIGAAASYSPVMQTPPQTTGGGTPTDGDALGSTVGSWSGPGGPFTYTYQWQRCNAAGASCSDIPGATGETYVLTPADVQPGGRTIRVCVTATNSYGSTTVCSDPTGVIQARPVANLTPPSISEQPKENMVLSPGGTWGGTPPIAYSYQWLRCDAGGSSCVDIAGATQSGYVVTHDDQGATLRVRVTASNATLPGGSSVTDTSAATAVVTVISAIPDARYATNGTVSAITRSGGTTYVGGSFSLVGKPTGAFAELASSDGTASMDIPPVSGGDIRAVESDGAGGWFIGGSFARVGNLSRPHLAHILADGSVDPDWANIAPSSVVDALSLGGGGSTLYIGGHFSTVGGQTRNRAAAVNVATGAVTSWNPNVGFSGDSVTSILASGSTVYLGGWFNSVGGVARSYLVEVSATTGALTAFNPVLNEYVTAMQKVGNVLYIGGGFTQVNGTVRNRAAAIDTSTGSLTAWNPNLGPFNSVAYALRVSGSTVFLGGSFNTAGGVSHMSLVGVNATTGAVTWNPSDPGSPFGGLGAPIVWALDVSGSTVYVGGAFTSIGTSTRRGLAAFNSTTGALTSWAPHSSDTIHALGAGAGSLYVGGGDVTGPPPLMNTVARSNAAAFDSDGLPTAWAPNPSAVVRALTPFGGNIYMGGDFTTVAGLTRNRLAAVDPALGVPTAWAPDVNGPVNALAASASRIYAGGDFTTVGALTRNRLAAFTSDSSTATTWSPSPNATVRALQVGPTGTIYAGGDFTTAGGMARNRLAAFTSAASTATSWNPNMSAPVRALYVASDGTIYAGGDFTTAGGLARNRLAAFTSAASTATSWNPDSNGSVYALHGNGGTIWAGGSFSAVGGQSRARIAALRPASGTATGWNPGADATVRAVFSDPSGTHVGGDFLLIGPQVPQSYAHFR